MLSSLKWALLLIYLDLITRVVKPLWGVQAHHSAPSLPPSLRWQTFYSANVLQVINHSAWYSLFDFSPPPLSIIYITYLIYLFFLFVMVESDEGIRLCNKGKEGLRWRKKKVIYHFGVQIFLCGCALKAAATHLSEWKAGESPRPCCFQSIWFVSHGLAPFFIHLPGHLVLAWVTAGSNSTFT